MNPAKKKIRGRQRHQPNAFRLSANFETRCFEVVDSAETRIPASFLLQARPSRDPAAQLSRLVDQFVDMNRLALRELELSVTPRYQSGNVNLSVQAGTRVGAIPLLSPTSGRYDYGIVVRPRFDWPGIGPILAATGWRVIPAPLAMPSLPNSERRIPPWVLSTVALFRLRELLEQLQRRFETTSAELSSPRGTIIWDRYLVRQVTRARFLSVPCTFPELQTDRDLRSAVHFALNRQLRSLESQRRAGSFVLELIEFCQSLIARVADVPPRAPQPTAFEVWRRRTLHSAAFNRGIEAIQWTAEERGLAGLSELSGLPWAMSMDNFFEAWTETVISGVVHRIGGNLRTGRKRETVVPLNWDPPYLGSQKSLVPDIVVERGDTTVIVDAKYKEHWEELQQRRWADLQEELRERHRADLLQILAYSSVAKTPKVLMCLAYPCKEQRWLSLRNRKLLVHRASLPTRDRHIALALVAFPLSTRLVSELISVMADEILRVAA